LVKTAAKLLLLYFLYRWFVDNRLVAGSGSSLVQRMAQGVAMAEGYFRTDIATIAQQRNNPGNLTATTGEIAWFGSAMEGWQALYSYLGRMIDGEHPAYSPSMTLREAAVIYTGNDNPEGWARTVANALGLSPNTRLMDLGLVV
jgi:hypothetical protein